MNENHSPGGRSATSSDVEPFSGLSAPQGWPPKSLQTPLPLIQASPLRAQAQSLTPAGRWLALVQENLLGPGAWQEVSGWLGGWGKSS